MDIKFWGNITLENKAIRRLIECSSPSINFSAEVHRMVLKGFRSDPIYRSPAKRAHIRSTSEAIFLESKASA